jgi:hypothetical protein
MEPSQGRRDKPVSLRPWGAIGETYSVPTPQTQGPHLRGNSETQQEPIQEVLESPSGHPGPVKGQGPFTA